MYMWVFPKNWGYLQIIHFNGVFHYKPSMLGYPYFWKHPHVHPGRLTAGTPTHHPWKERNIIFQFTIFRFYVNLRGGYDVASTGTELTYPTKWEVRKIIDSRLTVLRGYVSSQEGYIPKYIGSMGLVYSPTWMVNFDGKCRWIYQSHGSYGYIYI